MKTRLSIMLLLAVAGIAIGDEKPSTSKSKAEKAAISKYDKLPDDFKEKAVTAWRTEMKLSAGDAKRLKSLLKNDPPFYPPIYSHMVAIEGLNFKKGDWGHLNVLVNTSTGVYVDAVVDKTRIVCRTAGSYFVVTMPDTSDIETGAVTEIKGVFHFDGTKQNFNGRQLVVLKPVPMDKNEVPAK